MSEKTVGRILFGAMLLVDLSVAVRSYFMGWYDVACFGSFVAGFVVALIVAARIEGYI